MIYGIGTDIVRIQRMADNLERFGERFAHRILTELELSTFEKSSVQAQFLSKRFAAKEAAAKAMGTGFRNGLGLRDIGVSNDDLGKPSLVFSPKASQYLQSIGVGEVHLSLSDEQEYAIAYVILEKKKSE